MNRLTATCTNPKCGKEFDASGGLKMTNATATLKGNTVQCPYCGSPGKVIEGTFKFDEKGLIQLLSQPEFTPDILRGFKKVVEEAQTKKYSSEKFREEAEKVSPVVAGLFLTPEFQAAWSMINTGLQTTFAFLGVLISVLTLMESKKEKVEKPPVVNVYITPSQSIHIEQIKPTIIPKKPKLISPKKTYSPVKKKKRGRQ